MDTTCGPQKERCGWTHNTFPKTPQRNCSIAERVMVHHSNTNSSCGQTLFKSKEQTRSSTVTVCYQCFTWKRRGCHKKNAKENAWWAHVIFSTPCRLMPSFSYMKCSQCIVDHHFDIPSWGASMQETVNNLDALNCSECQPLFQLPSRAKRIEISHYAQES